MARIQEQFVKFCRTRHIFDAGGSGVSRDDLLMTSRQAQTFLKEKTILIEEKVDGANIGITVDNNYQIKVQNRAHFINSSTHRQFSMLDTWIDKHSEDLLSILKPDIHILFGEWLYAKHSIHYVKLPDYFLAFDIYDKVEERFLSVQERNNAIGSTGISLVRTVGIEKNMNKKKLMELLQTKSEYYDGFVEGLILRTEGNDDEKTPSNIFENRAKLVRPDFLQQIEEQWTKQKFTKNQLLYY